MESKPAAAVLAVVQLLAAAAAAAAASAAAEEKKHLCKQRLALLERLSIRETERQEVSKAVEVKVQRRLEVRSGGSEES